MFPKPDYLIFSMLNLLLIIKLDISRSASFVCCCSNSNVPADITTTMSSNLIYILVSNHK